MVKKLRKAKSGTVGDIKLCGMDVYHKYEALSTAEMSVLGARMDKDAFICSRVLEPKDQQRVRDMLADWQLYEHGWLVTTDELGNFRNNHLFYFKCQIGDYGSHKPEALQLLQQ